jgi:hypothetical protein
MAEQEWIYGTPSYFDPLVTPVEKWALFSHHPHLHILTGDLSTDILAFLGFDTAAAYLQNKHGLKYEKLHYLNMEALSWHISGLNLFQRASYVKLIHDWVPTFLPLCRQGREPSPLCPRCNQSVETPSHVIQCPHPDAISCRVQVLSNFLSHLVKIHTPILSVLFHLLLFIIIFTTKL